MCHIGRMRVHVCSLGTTLFLLSGLRFLLFVGLFFSFVGLFSSSVGSCSLAGPFCSSLTFAHMSGCSFWRASASGHKLRLQRFRISEPVTSPHSHSHIIMAVATPGATR